METREEVHMTRSVRGTKRGFVILSAVTAGLLGLAVPVAAQTAGGEATAVQATLLGATTTLADTGLLAAGTPDALQASSIAGSVPSLLTADTLHATTIASADQTESEASLGSLGVSLPGVTITADFLMARALAVVGAAGAAAGEVDGLVINGVPIQVTGAPNQTVPIIGGMVVINEQQTGSGGAVVNALHVLVSGLVDVVVASATAGTAPSTGSTPLPLPLSGLL
jgi:hypothetical protein